MTGIPLTAEQATSVDKQFFTDDVFFNVVPNANGQPFLILSEQDKTIVAGTKYAWILEITETNFQPPAPSFSPGGL